jgi:predicted MFS family arabinose efflux permease
MDKQFKITMIAVHFILLIFAIILMFSHKDITLNMLLVIAWVLMFGFIPVGWSTWIIRTLADRSEMMGGLSVTAIQFSIGLAAGIGGIIFDHKGILGIFFSAALIFLFALILIQLRFRFQRQN